MIIFLFLLISYIIVLMDIFVTYHNNDMIVVIMIIIMIVLKQKCKQLFVLLSLTINIWHFCYKWLLLLWYYHHKFGKNVSLMQQTTHLLVLRDLVDLLVHFLMPLLTEDSVQLHSFLQRSCGTDFKVHFIKIICICK